MCNYYDDNDTGPLYSSKGIIIEQEKRCSNVLDELSCVIKIPPNSKFLVFDKVYSHAFYVMSGGGYYFKNEINNLSIITMFFIDKADDFVVEICESCKIFSGNNDMVLFLDKRKK